MEKQQKNILKEPTPNYEKAEDDLLKNGLNRSYTERFLMMTTLMKRNIMFSKAIIKHKPLSSSKE